ncbi:hypothetical protein EV426DRAFT_433046 [Tirmania nivea]|nr:hypothetical protein EV426DRAFT_433046 [Tirmania nivea]
MDDNSEQANKKRKPMTNSTSYLKMTIAQAEERLNIRLDEVPVISVDEMLATVKHTVKKADVDAMKEKLHERLVEHIEGEGYPTEANLEFKESNVSVLVYTIVLPIVTDFRRKTGRNIRLTREKKIVSTDNTVVGEEEFVIWTGSRLRKRNLCASWKARGVLLERALNSVCLALKDGWENYNLKDNFLYGFVTTGEDWRMFRYFRGD